MRLIDADALLNDPANISSNEFGDDVVYVEDINKAPTVERPHGEWVFHKEWELDGECAFECSRCGMGTDVDYNFCPNCGSDNRKRGEAE